MLVRHARARVHSVAQHLRARTLVRAMAHAAVSASGGQEAVAYYFGESRRGLDFLVDGQDAGATPVHIATAQVGGSGGGASDLHVGTWRGLGVERSCYNVSVRR